MKKSVKSLQFAFFLSISLMVLCITGCIGLKTDGTVLIDNNGTMTDTRVGLMWQAERSAKKINSGAEAQDYVTELSLAGFTDWRLPTSQELWDLYFTNDYSMSGLLAKKIKMKGSYWTQDNDKIMAGFLEDGNDPGINRYFFNSRNGFVRAVRSLK
jgi:hypothetical protein